MQNIILTCFMGTGKTTVGKLLLDVPNPAERIALLLAARREGYGRFPQIATDGKTADQVATEIIDAVQSS